MKETIIYNPSLGKREGIGESRYTAKSKKAVFCDYISAYSASTTAFVPDLKLAHKIRPAAKITFSKSDFRL